MSLFISKWISTFRYFPILFKQEVIRYQTSINASCSLLTPVIKLCPESNFRRHIFYSNEMGRMSSQFYLFLSNVPTLHSVFLTRTLYVFDNATKGQTETTSVTINEIVICDVKAETSQGISRWGRTISSKLDVSSSYSKNLQLQQDMWLDAANQEKQ